MKRRKESRETYQEWFRATWNTYLLCSPAWKIHLEEFMADLQMKCMDANKPNVEWGAFIDTLPGYRSYWTRKKSGK